jgi:inner membrane transporter RhtA
VGVAGTSLLRFFFASLMMGAVFKPWKIKKISKNLLFYGASLGLMNFSFYFALQRIPLGIAVALEFLGPLAVAIFSSHKKIDYLWAFLAGIGIFLLFPIDPTIPSLDPVGLILAILSGVFWALYIITGKKAGSDLQGGLAASLGMAIATLIVLPFSLYIDGDKIFNPSVIPVALVVAFFGSALPYTLEMIALKRLSTNTFGILMSLEPALAALMGLIFLKETLTIVQWMAISSIIISSIGSSLTTNKS